jgi:hypothetical protein
MRGLRSADTFEYGRPGAMGWAQEHVLVAVVGAVCGWLAVIYAVYSAVLTMR